jgi:hypothetical protein
MTIHTGKERRRSGSCKRAKAHSCWLASLWLPTERCRRLVKDSNHLEKRCGPRPSNFSFPLFYNSTCSEHVFCIEYTLRRYSTYDLLTEATDTRLLLAIKEAEGVDFQGRALQKHALGPLAVRFHTVKHCLVFLSDTS